MHVMALVGSCNNNEIITSVLEVFPYWKCFRTGSVSVLEVFPYWKCCMSRQVGWSTMSVRCQWSSITSIVKTTY